MGDNEQKPKQGKGKARKVSEDDPEDDYEQHNLGAIYSSQRNLREQQDAMQRRLAEMEEQRRQNIRDVQDYNRRLRQVEEQIQQRVLLPPPSQRRPTVQSIAGNTDIRIDVFSNPHRTIQLGNLFGEYGNVMTRETTRRSIFDAPLDDNGHPLPDSRQEIPTPGGSRHDHEEEQRGNGGEERDDLLANLERAVNESQRSSHPNHTVAPTVPGLATSPAAARFQAIATPSIEPTANGHEQKKHERGQRTSVLTNNTAKEENNNQTSSDGQQDDDKAQSDQITQVTPIDTTSTSVQPPAIAAPPVHQTPDQKPTPRRGGGPRRVTVPNPANTVGAGPAAGTRTSNIQQTGRFKHSYSYEYAGATTAGTELDSDNIIEGPRTGGRLPSTTPKPEGSMSAPPPASGTTKRKPSVQKDSAASKKGSKATATAPPRKSTSGASSIGGQNLVFPKLAKKSSSDEKEEAQSTDPVANLPPLQSGPMRPGPRGEVQSNVDRRLSSFIAVNRPAATASELYLASIAEGKDNEESSPSRKRSLSGDEDDDDDDESEDEVKQSPTKKAKTGRNLLGFGFPRRY